jgi:hypothetical protein
MTSTKEGAASHGVCVDDTVPAVDGYNEPYQGNRVICRRSLARFEVARRADGEINPLPRLRPRPFPKGEVTLVVKKAETL